MKRGGGHKGRVEFKDDEEKREEKLNGKQKKETGEPKTKKEKMSCWLMGRRSQW